MAGLGAEVARLKAELDQWRPLKPHALGAMQPYWDLELTWSSNAIEGNTLTFRETAELIEHGITVGGKPLRDHLEAEDHHAALQWMHALAGTDTVLDEATVTELHRRIVLRSRPEIAGLYSTLPRRVAGSSAIFPNPARLPALMAAFGAELAQVEAGAEATFDRHYRLVAIHPFADGNGRTARLLMNLLLIRGGYPLVAVRPEDRSRYLESLETASVTDDLGPFQTLMHERLLATLASYLDAYRQALPDTDQP